jgi:dTDP-4-amino-4,6-dideoxygalactose transaminase
VTLVTLSPAVAERAGEPLRELRIGDGLAALARATLSRWEDVLSARREIAAEYSSALLRYDAFRLPPTPQDAIPTYAAFLLRLTRFARTGADDLAKLLAESGIEVRRLLAPGTERDLGRLPVAEEALTRGILLPTRPDLTREERERTLDAIFDFAIG